VLKRLPLIPTLVVLAAVALMVRLGFWQIDRMHEKEALLARYAAASVRDAMTAWPTSDREVEQRLYHQTTVTCRKVLGRRTMSGRNQQGVAGIAQIATCELLDPSVSIENDQLREADIVLGWSKDLVEPAWPGGEVRGMIAPGPRLVADPPLAGLQANATPDPRELANNHWSYAIQWFLFAGIALVIYGLALRKRLGGK
jgi:surfeit locus 1 family protein